MGPAIEVERKIISRTACSRRVILTELLNEGLFGKGCVAGVEQFVQVLPDRRLK
jgi:hypothetical protein